MSLDQHQMPFQNSHDRSKKNIEYWKSEGKVWVSYSSVQQMNCTFNIWNKLSAPLMRSEGSWDFGLLTLFFGYKRNFDNKKTDFIEIRCYIAQCEIFANIFLWYLRFCKSIKTMQHFFIKFWSLIKSLICLAIGGRKLKFF